MVDFTMHNWGRFRSERQACDAFLKDPHKPSDHRGKRLKNFVYLIYRFDDDDDAFGSIWDERYHNRLTTRAPQDKPTPVSFGGPKPFSLASSSSGGGVWPPTVQGYGGVVRNVLLDDRGRESRIQSGGHAEEIFIRSLPKLNRDYGGPPKTIHIYVSKIPCMSIGRHGSGPFLMGGGAVMPSGCGSKLQKLVNMYQTVNFAIAFGDDYSSDVKMHRATMDAMRTVDSKPNASVYRLNERNVLSSIRGEF